MPPAAAKFTSHNRPCYAGLQEAVMAWHVKAEPISVQTAPRLLNRKTLRCRRRASAAVDTLVAETRSRAGTLAGGASQSGAMKRKRVQAPEEECPYCEHTYTVRDGLSAKVDDDGARCCLHSQPFCSMHMPHCRIAPCCSDPMLFAPITV